jgi:hypothetical protein
MIWNRATLRAISVIRGNGSFLSQTGACVAGALARFLAQPVSRPAASGDVLSLSPLLRPGDVLGDTSTRQTGCTFLQPVFATIEEVCYAHELRLQLRTRLMRDAVAPTHPWCVGAD